MGEGGREWGSGGVGEWAKWAREGVESVNQPQPSKMQPPISGPTMN